MLIGSRCHPSSRSDLLPLNPFRRTAGSRISPAQRWRPHDFLTSSRGRAPQPSRSIRIHRNARCEPKRCAAASPFSYRRPDCAAASKSSIRAGFRPKRSKRLQAYRATTAGQRRWPSREARRHCQRLRHGHARWAALWQGRRLQRPGIRHLARARSPADACRHDRARSAGRHLRAPRSNRSAAQCDRDANPRDSASSAPAPHRRVSTGGASAPRTFRKCRFWPNSRE